MIEKVQPLGNWQLSCTFDNGMAKLVDIKPFLQSEAFKPLHDQFIFCKVRNNGYFISWLNEEIDLSVDTLWHSGIEEKN